MTERYRGKVKVYRGTNDNPIIEEREKVWHLRNLSPAQFENLEYMDKDVPSADITERRQLHQRREEGPAMQERSRPAGDIVGRVQDAFGAAAAAREGRIDVPTGYETMRVPYPGGDPVADRYGHEIHHRVGEKDIETPHGTVGRPNPRSMVSPSPREGRYRTIMNRRN